MTKILITGATGFIGSWLVKYFAKLDFNIIAHGSSEESVNKLKDNLEKANINLKNIEFWRQDFLKSRWDFPDLSKNDTIIHCAAATKVREGTFENYDRFFALNVLATKILAKKALDVKVRHFMHISTGQVFGIPHSFPFTEETPKNPINIYGFTKLIGEMVVRSFGNLGLNYTIARPFSVYGKGQYNIISIIKDKIFNGETLTIYGDGAQSRAFTHINDICEAIGLILNNKKAFNEEYNLSGQHEYSVNDLVQLIAKKLNREPKIANKKGIVNELRRNIADITKILKLGFSYQESLEDFIENDLFED